MLGIAQKLGAVSLKVKLGLGAAVLGGGTCLTALILWFGLQDVSERLDTALAAEARMSRYATLSQQAASFLVVSSEAVQSELPAQERAARIAPVAQQLRQTFEHLQGDVQQAVEQTRSGGLDAQTRHGTQSLGIARMEAMLGATLQGLAADTPDKARLRAHIDTFASRFDLLLNQAVAEEVRFRNDILSGIEDQRQRLSMLALVIAAVTICAVALFYFGLIRPQFARLDGLSQAARRIGQADFAVALPVDRGDEIGQLYSETNRMAQALSARQTDIEQEWARLNDTIAERTEDLRAANTRLAEIDADRKRFFADVSHELRTPLTVILMEAQIGAKASGDPAFATIEARAARLNRRIDDLLRVARSESGQLALDIQPGRVADLMADVAEEVRAEVDNAGMALTLSEAPDGEIACDVNWIRQVLVGLIRNAIRHARAGERVGLAARHTDGMLELTVTDNGPGIPAANQEGIFDRFQQAGTETAQGFGIGLALARWVVEAHGGSVIVESPVSREKALGDAPGTKVLVTLPFQSTP